MSKSTTPSPAPKDFPLWKHPSGRWCKKIRGKAYYFGKVSDGWSPALDKYLAVRDDLMAGRTPKAHVDGVTVRQVCNAFLTNQYRKLQCDKLAPCTFADCKETTDRLATALGDRAVSDLTPRDFNDLMFKMSETRNAETVGNEINRIRGVFKWCKENKVVEELPDYGSDFRRASKLERRKIRAARPKKFFEAAEIQAMLAKANVQLCAMILLGVNAGFGNSDIASLPISAVNLDTRWIDFARVKTGVERRVPLWPETCDAIRAWLAIRPEPNNQEAHGDLLFITAKSRTAWSISKRIDAANPDMHEVARQCRKTSDSPLSKEMRKLLNSLGITRRGVSFYSLRHVFETIGGRSRDQVAVNAVMGHVDESMADSYREEVDDSRLQAVTDHVRNWLFAAQEK